MIDNKKISAVGKFQKTHALKGELNALLDIDPEYFTEGNAAIIETDGILVPFFVKSVRPKGNYSYLVMLDGVDSEEEARTFVNKTIYAEKSRLAGFLDMDEEELVDGNDLIGYDIINSKDMTRIGEVTGFETSTQNTLFIVKKSDGVEIFVPAADDFISEIDDERKCILMDLPDGLPGI